MRGIGCWLDHSGRGYAFLGMAELRRPQKTAEMIPGEARGRLKKRGRRVGSRASKWEGVERGVNFSGGENKSWRKKLRRM